MFRYGTSFPFSGRAALAAALLLASAGSALAASSGAPGFQGPAASAPAGPIPRSGFAAAQPIAPPLNLGQTNINPAGTGGVNPTGPFAPSAGPSSGPGTGLPANGTVDSSLGVTRNE